MTLQQGRMHDRCLGQANAEFIESIRLPLYARPYTGICSPLKQLVEALPRDRTWIDCKRSSYSSIELRGPRSEDARAHAGLQAKCGVMVSVRTVGDICFPRLFEARSWMGG